MLHKVDQWLSRLLPRECVLCGMDAGSLNLCAGCLGDLPWIGRACERCGAPLPSGVAGGSCAHCDVNCRDIDGIIAGLAYEYPVDRLIAGAKFDRRPEFAMAVGEALAQALRIRPFSSPDVVMPVPLHPARLGRRGFNQALEIAIPVCRTLGLRLDRRSCRRHRDTAPQTSLPAARRRTNLRGAFAVSDQIAGLRVAIVDDVVTSGSTVSAMAACLRAAGAESIVVWAGARVLRNQPDWKV